jgi:hypothetical protein
MAKIFFHCVAGTSLVHQALRNTNGWSIRTAYTCVSYDKYILRMHGLLYLFFGHFTAGDLEFGECLLNDRFSERHPVF